MHYPCKKFLFIITFVALLLPVTGICQLSTDAPWPMFHRDLRHTGKTTNFGTQVGKLKWQFVTSGPVTSSPAIDKNGIVYVGSTDNNLYAIDAEIGSLKWKFQTQGAIDKSSPAIDVNGVLYVGSYGDLTHGLLYAFDTNTINPNNPTYKWIFETYGAIVSSPSIAPDGTIIFGCSDGNLYAVNPDGTLKWSTFIGDTGASPAIDIRVNQIYIGTWKPDIFYALDLSSGTITWQYTFLCGGSFGSPVVESDSTVIFTNFTTYYSDESCLDAFKFQVYNFSSDGGVISALTPTAIPNWKLDLEQNDIYNTPAVLEDNTFFIASGTSFYRINPDGSQYLFTALDGERVESSPAIDGKNFIFVGSNGGRFYCVHADRPENPSIWAYPLKDEDPINGQIISSPAIGEDERHSVYVGATDGNIYAFYDGIRIKGKVSVIEGSGSSQTRKPLQAVKLTLKSEILAQDRITYTDSDGVYEFAGLENFAYTVTPEKPGYIFNPESLTITVKDQDVNNANFEAFGGFSISGTVTDKTGQGLPGVSVSLKATNSLLQTTQTDGTGAYEFTGLGFDTYTVTPFLDGYGFTPPFQTVTIASTDIDKNKININFTASLGYQISGKVTDVQGNGIKGVNITLTGTRNDAAITDDSGAYSFVELENGKYTVTTSFQNYDFNPPYQTVTIASASVYNVDFTAAIGNNISGYTFEGSNPLIGVSVDLFDKNNPKEIKQTVKSDDTGFFILIGVTDGTYIVKPHITGYGFSPLSSIVKVAGKDISNVNFRATKGLYIGGTVTNILNMPLSNVPIDLGDATGKSTDSITTDSSGQYVFLGLQPGIYTVMVNTVGYTAYPASQKVDMLAESREDVNFLVIPTCPLVFLNIPFFGSSGTQVNIIGMNFGLQEPAPGTMVNFEGDDKVKIEAGVYFGSEDVATWIKADVTSWSPFYITAKAPTGGSGVTHVWVLNDKGCIYKPAPFTNFFIYGF